MDMVGRGQARPQGGMVCTRKGEGAAVRGGRGQHGAWPEKGQAIGPTGWRGLRHQERVTGGAVSADVWSAWDTASSRRSS